MSQYPSPVLIVGATSDIAKALARAYGAAGCDLVLAARDPGQLVADQADLTIRHGVKVTLATVDVTQTDPANFFDAWPLCGTLVMVAGLLGDQAESEADATAANLVMNSNFNGPVVWLLAAAQRMEARGSGHIVGISSVAGDRGRASNFVYGASKAGLTAALSGLRNKLAGRGVLVVTVKPGFVDTRMTAGMKLSPRLTATPHEVARAILRAQAKRRDVVYVKPVWWPIMTIIRALPERLFKRTKL